MPRSSFAVFVAVGTALLVVGAATLCRGATGSAQPNVVVFYTDDQNNNAVGCYGGDVSTPYIDSLAADGIKFTR